jgi:hypothetical protein
MSESLNNGILETTTMTVLAMKTTVDETAKAVKDMQAVFAKLLVFSTEEDAKNALPTLQTRLKEIYKSYKMQMFLADGAIEFDVGYLNLGIARKEGNNGKEGWDLFTDPERNFIYV